jgi:hypothetical protein
MTTPIRWVALRRIPDLTFLRPATRAEHRLACEEIYAGFHHGIILASLDPLGPPPERGPDTYVRYDHPEGAPCGPAGALREMPAAPAPEGRVWATFGEIREGAPEGLVLERDDTCGLSYLRSDPAPSQVELRRELAPAPLRLVREATVPDPRGTAAHFSSGLQRLLMAGRCQIAGEAVRERYTWIAERRAAGQPLKDLEGTITLADTDRRDYVLPGGAICLAAESSDHCTWEQLLLGLHRIRPYLPVDVEIYTRGVGRSVICAAGGALSRVTGCKPRLLLHGVHQTFPDRPPSGVAPPHKVVSDRIEQGRPVAPIFVIVSSDDDYDRRAAVTDFRRWRSDTFERDWPVYHVLYARPKHDSFIDRPLHLATLGEAIAAEVCRIRQRRDGSPPVTLFLADRVPPAIAFAIGRVCTGMGVVRAASSDGPLVYVAS